MIRKMRWAAWCSTAGVFFVVAMMLVGPAVAQSAPWTDAVVNTSTSTNYAGCAIAHIRSAPAFQPSSGEFSLSQRTVSKYCGSAQGSSSEAYTDVYVEVPLKIPKAGSPSNGTHVLIRTTIDAVLNSQVGTTSCTLHNTTLSSCDVTAVSYLVGAAYLDDLTNHSVWYPVRFWPGLEALANMTASCQHSVCTFYSTSVAHAKANSTFTWRFDSEALKRTHRYVVYVEFYATSDTYDYSYRASLTGGAVGTAVTMSGPTLGAWLNSISIVP